MSKVKKEYIYFRKVLSKEIRMKLDGLTEFKISLTQVETEHIEVMKSYLHIASNKILINLDDFDKNSAVEYLKISYHKALLDLYGLEVPDYKNLSLKKQSDILTLEKAINRYIEHKTGRIENSTLENYEIFKNHLYNYFNKDTDIETITAVKVEDYQNYLKKLGKSNGTINNIISFPKGAFKYLMGLKLASYNAFSSAKDLEVESNKEALTNLDIKKVLTKNSNKTINLMLKLGLYAGFRIGEVWELQVESIDIKNGFIHSKMKDTKTKKHTRIIPIHSDLIEDLKEAIKDRTNGRLIHFNGEKRASKTLNELVNKYVKKTTGTKLKTFHATRHSFSKQIEDYNLKDIKILLGHKASDITTKSYLKSDTNWAKKVEMINQIDYTNLEISDVEIAINKIQEAA